MKLFQALTVIILTLGLFVSCSSPSPDAENYLKKNTGPAINQSSSNEVVDITAQGASAIPAAAIKKAEPNPEEALKKTVSPGNLPKCVDQYAGAKKVWEKMKEIHEHYGDTPYLFELGDRGFINGNPMNEMGANASPIPLFKTWDSTKLSGVSDVHSFISHGAQVRIKSRRRTDEGNWYMVTILNTGFENIKGWVPERLVSSTSAVPAGSAGGFSSGACSTGG